MNEVIFVVEQAPDGGYTARALGDAIFTQAALRPGEHLLVHGAAGGVGTAAVQIGRAAGARIESRRTRLIARASGCSSPGAR